MSQQEPNEPNPPARPQVVKMLTRLLEKAKQGQITSVALVAFNQGRPTDFSAEFTQASDMDCAPECISRLKKGIEELALGSQG